MIIEGESSIPVERLRVWQALNDPEVLRRCIPGCQSLEQLAENEFATKVRASVGPISATFNAMVTLTDMEPGRGYTIVGEGKGGAAGFARGQARVDLEDEERGTRLRYKADVNVGGKLAQVGSRLIQATARKLSEQFFGSFVEALSADAPRPQAQAVPAAVPSASVSPPSSSPAPAAGRWMAWGAAAVVLAAALGWWMTGR